MRDQKGFTLIEILIAVAVVGLLASIVLVGLGPVQRQGRDTRRIADLRSVETALGLYFNKFGTYPGANQSIDWDELEDDLVDASIGVRQIPHDPRATATGVDYEYASDGVGYVLKAEFEDTDNPNLNSDVDGSIFNSVDCDDENGEGSYCIQF